MARFMITLSAHPIGKEGRLVVETNEKGIQISPIVTSVRESRAKRQARRLVKDGERNVMLWRVDGAHPVPIRYRESTAKVRYPTHNGCNSTTIDLTESGLIDREKAPGRRAAARLDHFRRTARKTAIAMEANDRA